MKIEIKLIENVNLQRLAQLQDELKWFLVEYTDIVELIIPEVIS